MDTNSSGYKFTKPKESEKICIRKYVADVRRKDWRKCFPFNLPGDSQESNYQAERIFASPTLDDNDALVNAPKNTKGPNSSKSSEVENPEGQAAISETLTGVVIGNDANTVNDTPVESASSNLTNSHYQIEETINGDTVAAENDKPEDMVVDDDPLNDINDGAPNSSSSELQNNVQHQNENIISEDTEAAGDDKYTTSDEERNLAGEKPKKFRLLSDILKNLAGPSDARSAACGDMSDFSSESEDDSDEFTLDTSNRKRKGVRVTSKRAVVSKKKKKPYKLRAKRIKPIPEDSSSKDPEVGSKRLLRKCRTDKVALQVMNKHKKSSAEIYVHGSTSGTANVAPSSLGGRENLSETQKDSLISRGNKRNRETIQDDSGRDVLMPLDGSPMIFTGENSSSSARGVKDAQLVQSTTAISKNIEAASGSVQESIMESSPPIDNESMAALQLLRLFNSGAPTDTSSKPATEDPELSVLKDDKMSSASGSIVGQSHDELKMINNGDYLPLAEQIETGSVACAMNRSPSEFSIPNAKKHMRRGRAKVIPK